MGKASTTLNECLYTPKSSSTAAGYSYDPINYLPVELLIQVFALCVGDDSPLIPLTLSRVCRAWHDVVHSIPDVWRRVSLDDQRPISVSHAQAELWLRQSRPHPVDVHIQLSELNNLLPLLTPFFPHINRCGSLEIAGKVEEKIDLARLSDEHSQASVYHLGITIKGETELEDEEGSPGPATVSQYPPYLSSRHAALLNKLCVRVTLAKELPLAPLMSTINIRSLTIMENSSEVMPDPVRLVNFLAFCPQLEELRFSGYPNEPSPQLSQAAMPVVPLRYLHTLIIRSTCAVRAILSHIHAPALTSLYLEHTNMEFELHHSASYNGEAEDGDSDDEAHDFSQSPWSDHGTGMGLRSLIRRSHPPLEVLDMNYADMRTKDFLWCFSKLRKLREFRIVASDMSDKVIHMLAPFATHRRERERDALLPIADGEDELELRVRMPHLTTLELQHCPRLTGDALVSALEARVRFTDEAFGDRREGRQMRRVAVVGCDGFQPRHVMSLLPILNARLRTTME